jgi:hypothetical protein
VLTDSTEDSTEDDTEAFVLVTPPCATSPDEVVDDSHGLASIAKASPGVFPDSPEPVQ